MQFHATDGVTSRTLFQELRDKSLDPSEQLLLGFCAQVVEAVQYLHDDVQILHNDITTSNIVIDGDHIVLIDFGKATEVLKAKFYSLGEAEKQEYVINYPHLAPEVIDGRKKQSVYSDMYSVGLIFYRVSDHRNVSPITKRSLTSLAEKCRCIDISGRPNSSVALKYFQDNIILGTE